MAESKPTKLQMSKEIQHLIEAAQDMSVVMDLEPPIKTDYLIDLKNKTVTVSHLNQVVSSLQAGIKRDAKMIEPGDKFHKGTHEVLADLNVKVPRLSAEDLECDIMPTPSPPMEEEKEKPVKKEKKKKEMSACTFVGHLVCDDMDMNFETLRKKVDEAGYTISDSTIRTVKTDVGKIVAYLKESGRIK